MRVQVTRVNNPFNRHDKDCLTVSQDGWDFISKELQKLPQDSFYLYVNGNPYPITHKIQDNDQITIIPRVAGGGDSSKAWLNILAIFGLAFFGVPFVADALGVQAGTFAYTLVAMTVMVGGGMLINSLMPSPTGDKPGLAEYNESYGWNPQNTQQQGLAIPRFYGKNKIFGNVISVHTETDPADDTKEILKALICLGMGPVKGIVTNKIFINDQPYIIYDGVTVEEKRGLITQSAVSFFQNTKPEYRVGILVENGDPQMYLMPDADYDDLEVVLAWDRGLYYANDEGGISNHTVGIKVEIREYPGGVWNTLVNCNVTAKVTEILYKTYLASGTYTGGSPVTIQRGTKYQIRVTKTTADKTSARYGDRVKLFSVREILEDQFTYPRKSLLGVSAIATDQLSGGLTLSCIQEGLIVNVFNGSSWALQYSNNPAWVLYDILTQPVITGDGDGTPYSVVRYEGLDPSRLDLVKFYELAQFCDDLVDDGEGGTEKRITFNGGFETGTTMWEAALKICQVARCVLVWQGMNLTLAINKPGMTVQCFSDGNITEGTFKETFLPAEDRVSEVEVSYVDESQDFERIVFSIYDPDSDNFYNKATLDLYGITKASEAWRAGMLRLMENRYLYSTVEFDADIDAIACTIGDVIYVQSSIPDWGEGGRVISATTNSVVLDKSVSLGVGTKKILVRTYDAVSEQEQINEKTVDSIVGSTVTIVGTWTVTPTAGDVYAIGLTTVISKKYRVIALRKSTEQRLTITALEYNEAVYDGDDSEPVIPLENYTEPGSSGTNIIKPPTVEEIKSIYPIESILNMPFTADIPLFNGFGWTDDSPSAGSVTTSAFVIYYKGVTYNVAQFSSSDLYFYWDANYDPGSGAGLNLQATNSLSTATGTDKWIVGINDGGTLYPAFGRKIIHGGVIQADTLSGNAIIAGTLSVDTADIVDLAVQTGKIDNLAVGTIKIADDATGYHNSQSTAGDIAISTSWTEVEDITYTSDGYMINISGTVTFYYNGGSSGSATISLRLLEGTTQIALVEQTFAYSTSNRSYRMSIATAFQPVASGSITINLEAKSSSSSVNLARLRNIVTQEFFGK